MKRQDMLSIWFTFAVGFFGGGYLYIAHFSKVVTPDNVPTQAAAESFIIEGESYGGCKTDCPAFQVLGDGSYRYQFATQAGGEKIIKTGTLPLEIQRNVKNVLETETLTTQSQPLKPTDCNSYSDTGIDVRYKVTLDSAEYVLDSCGTTVDGESDVWNGLAQIWNYFQTIQ